MRYLKFLFVASVLAACGSEPSDPSAPEFSQNVNVNEIQYRIEEVQITAQIKFPDYVQNLNNSFSFEKNASKEVVVRKTVNDQYTLQINGKKADLNIGSSGQFESRREVNLNDGCRLTGTAEADGEAAYDRLDLVYELRIKLKGDDCPRSVQDDFVSFIEKELDGLNFDSLNRLRESESLGFEGSQEVLIRIRASGVVS